MKNSGCQKVKASLNNTHHDRMKDDGRVCYDVMRLGSLSMVSDRGVKTSGEFGFCGVGISSSGTLKRTCRAIGRSET